jgi:hypothetical protein
MEQPQIIPTGSRSKIPHSLTYPVGAKIVSEVLLGVPQFADLTIDFRFRKRFARCHETETPYPVIQVQYSGPARFFSASKSSEESGYYLPSWKVTVEPVPRVLRHVIRKKIIEQALPAIRTWLSANPHSTEREGVHGLEFTFDELKNELTCQEHASMEWQTTRVD